MNGITMNTSIAIVSIISGHAHFSQRSASVFRRYGEDAKSDDHSDRLTKEQMRRALPRFHLDDRAGAVDGGESPRQQHRGQQGQCPGLGAHSPAESRRWYQTFCCASQSEPLPSLRSSWNMS